MNKVRYNPDTETVQSIRDALDKNGGYCPCRITRNADTKCMCVDFQNMVKADQSGFCHCGLYESYSEDNN